MASLFKQLETAAGVLQHTAASVVEGVVEGNLISAEFPSSSTRTPAGGAARLAVSAAGGRSARRARARAGGMVRARRPVVGRAGGGTPRAAPRAAGR
jgi:hypothetical protein